MYLSNILCRIVDFADGAVDPIDFPIAPKVAGDRLLKRVGMNAQQVTASLSSWLSYKLTNNFGYLK